MFAFSNEHDMTHITLSGRYMTAEEAIADIVANQLPRIKAVGEWTPVVVATKISARRTSYGVQSWKPEMIAEGSQTNSDGTVSVRVA